MVQCRAGLQIAVAELWPAGSYDFEDSDGQVKLELKKLGTSPANPRPSRLQASGVRSV